MHDEDNDNEGSSLEYWKYLVAKGGMAWLKKEKAFLLEVQWLLSDYNLCWKGTFSFPFISKIYTNSLQHLD